MDNQTADIALVETRANDKELLARGYRQEVAENRDWPQGRYA